MPRRVGASHAVPSIILRPAAMMGCFVVLLHIPRLIGQPASRFEWTMTAVAATLTGAALLIRRYAT